MFDKILSKVGIGATKVDTILHESEVMRGDVITGEIRMTGGKTAQTINKLYLELQTQYTVEHDEGVSIQVMTLHRLDIDDHFTLEANEEAVYDFELQIPFEAPVSFGHTHSWLKTGLDVSWAFDPKDHDPVHILPDPATERVLVAAEQLGFHHTGHSGQCLAMHNPYHVPFVQNFDMKGSHTGMGRHIEELDFMIFADEHEAHIQIELDKRNHGLSGWLADEMDLDERHMRFNLGHDVEFTAADLESVLRAGMH